MSNLTPSTEQSLQSATTVFAEQRKLLFSIAYNMVGSVADTEDVLQETWLAWASADRDEVSNPRAYLVRITVNHALARLNRARRDREAYSGLWLPEPVVYEDDHADRSETVSYAMMVVLEALSPLERTVFVLQEAFGYKHPEIADILGRTPDSVRQLAHRARIHVRDRRVRSRPDRAVQRAATERFMDAAVGGNLAALLEVLAPDVVMWTDAAGRLGTAKREVRGSEQVMRLITFGTERIEDMSFRLIEINGDPAAAVYLGTELFAAVVLDADPDSGLVRAIYNVANPTKLRGLAA